MNKKIFIWIVIVLGLQLLLTPSGWAKEEIELKEAIGLGGSAIGGNGISYKYFFTPEQGIQLTGGIFGSTNDDVNYNFGLMYQKVVEETKLTRLFFAPGINWSQTIDLNEEDDIIRLEKPSETDSEQLIYYNDQVDEKSLATGVTWGIEFKIDRIGLAFYTGLKGSVDWEYPVQEYSSEEQAKQAALEKSYAFGLTGGVFLSYYY